MFDKHKIKKAYNKTNYVRPCQIIITQRKNAHNHLNNKNLRIHNLRYNFLN